MYRDFSLDRSSVLPLYYQIQRAILEDIQQGVLKPGELVPSEQEIAEELRVSRMTARQALKALCDMGAVFRERGKGTFVSGLKLEKAFRQVLSFSEEIQAAGSRPGSRVLSFESIVPGSDVQAALALAAGEEVFALRRLRLADDAPMGIECSYLPVQRFPDLLRRFEPSASLYRTLDSVYGVRVHVTDEIVEAGLADAKEAQLLGVTPGSPAFLFTRTSYVQSGERVEYVKSIYRGDRYKLANRLTRTIRVV